MGSHDFEVRSATEHVNLKKQDWPDLDRWARGGPFIDAQLDALAEAVGASKRTFVSLFKAAPHWIEMIMNWICMPIMTMLRTARCRYRTGSRPRRKGLR